MLHTLLKIIREINMGQGFNASNFLFDMWETGLSAAVFNVSEKMNTNNSFVVAGMNALNCQYTLPGVIWDLPDINAETARRIITEIASAIYAKIGCGDTDGGCITNMNLRQKEPLVQINDNFTNLLNTSSLWPRNSTTGLNNCSDIGVGIVTFSDYQEAAEKLMKEYAKPAANGAIESLFSYIYGKSEGTLELTNPPAAPLSPEQQDGQGWSPRTIAALTVLAISAVGLGLVVADHKYKWDLRGKVYSMASTAKEALSGFFSGLRQGYESIPAEGYVDLEMQRRDANDREKIIG